MIVPEPSDFEKKILKIVCEALQDAVYASECTTFNENDNEQSTIDSVRFRSELQKIVDSLGECNS